MASLNEIYFSRSRIPHSGVGWFFHSFTIGLFSFAPLYFLTKLILEIGVLRFILAMIGFDMLFGGD
ncbi:MAG TPA: hypothetical protein ENK26_13495 [Gammaproteobacteria bacterium]|nr:hypothetical protein [Gammaproteobacteria bacterium]